MQTVYSVSRRHYISVLDVTRGRADERISHPVDHLSPPSQFRMSQYQFLFFQLGKFKISFDSTVQLIESKSPKKCDIPSRRTSFYAGEHSVPNQLQTPL